jgi:hypothetical protein
MAGNPGDDIDRVLRSYHGFCPAARHEAGTRPPRPRGGRAWGDAGFANPLDRGTSARQVKQPIVKDMDRG